MLAISPAASAAITEALRGASIADGAGLRLAAGPRTKRGVAVEITFVTEPQPDDQVIERGAPADVMLEPATAELLDDQILDAAIEPDGAVTFALRPQPSPTRGESSGGS